MSDMKAKLYALADALEMRLTYRNEEIHGQTKMTLDLFKGYSPTIIASIENSMVDEFNGTIAVEGQVWGNLGFVCIIEDKTNHISFFVIDRSKRYKNSTAWTNRWSRAYTYEWLAKCSKAVYDRSVFDTEWELLENGPAKLRKYTDARKNGAKAKEAYDIVWG